MFDWSIRLSVYRYLVGGWGTNEFSLNIHHWRNEWCTMLSSALTCWVGVPFENAQRAYLADAKWPQALRKNYTSYTNALVRIAYEEGPYYLFKNSFSIYFGNFLQTFTLFAIYDFLNDKLNR